MPYIYTTRVYASDSIDSDQELYVVEKRALENLRFLLFDHAL